MTVRWQLLTLLLLLSFLLLLLLLHLPSGSSSSSSMQHTLEGNKFKLLSSGKLMLENVDCIKGNRSLLQCTLLNRTLCVYTCIHLSWVELWPLLLLLRDSWPLYHSPPLPHPLTISMWIINEATGASETLNTKHSVTQVFIQWQDSFFASSIQPSATCTAACLSIDPCLLHHLASDRTQATDAHSHFYSLSLSPCHIHCTLCYSMQNEMSTLPFFSPVLCLHFTLLHFPLLRSRCSPCSTKVHVNSCNTCRANSAGENRPIVSVRACYYCWKITSIKCSEMLDQWNRIHLHPATGKVISLSFLFPSICVGNDALLKKTLKDIESLQEDISIVNCIIKQTASLTTAHQVSAFIPFASSHRAFISSLLLPHLRLSMTHWKNFSVNWTNNCMRNKITIHSYSPWKSPSRVSKSQE